MSCILCKKTFYDTNKARKYCSHKCYSIDKKGKPSHKKRGKFIKCFFCHTEFYRPQNRIIKINFCSYKCYWDDAKGKDRSKTLPNYKGQFIDENGYMKIRIPANDSNKQKYVKRSRLVMEKHIGRPLTPIEIVHHKGINFPIHSAQNRQDDTIENLQLLKNVSEHMKLHAKIRKLNQRQDGQISSVSQIP